MCNIIYGKIKRVIVFSTLVDHILSYFSTSVTGKKNKLEIFIFMWNYNNCSKVKQCMSQEGKLDYHKFIKPFIFLFNEFL
jgi:hypothetical protein